jgi:SOS response regulatory protein OraA/RecX
MTSKSPDNSRAVSERSGAESPAPTDEVGAGGAAQAATLSQLRSAISEIDQRHAEGETGPFSGLSGGSLDPGSGDTGLDFGANSSGGAAAGSKRRSPADKRPRKKAKRTMRPQNDDNGWAEGDTDSLPDFLDASDVAGADWNDADTDDAPGSNAFAGSDLGDFDADEEDAPDFDTDYAKAKKTALNMLAMRDHASDELRKKLLKRDLMPEAVDVLIEKLQNSRLLNDEEFAHRFARAQRENRKLSRSVLKRELSKKGISPELASDAVADIDGEEELAREVAAKKAASTRRLDYAVRERRILGMLARRGFPSGVCIKVTREVLAED